jgi:hypothetical protein
MNIRTSPTLRPRTIFDVQLLVAVGVPPPHAATDQQRQAPPEDGLDQDDQFIRAAQPFRTRDDERNS